MSLGHSRWGGTPFHVGDFQIWAEIHYLDSPTDYREYLPRRREWKRSVEGELHMHEDGQNPWSTRAYSMCCLLVALSVVLAVGFLMLR